MNTIRTKADVERCYHDRSHDYTIPHVNVKVYRGIDDVRFPLDETPTGLTREWIDEHISDEQADALFWQTCEFEWEMLQADAEEIFGRGVEVCTGGRSGGWACVTGLNDVDEWDAVMLAKWRRFARYAEAYANGIPEQMVYSIAANEHEAWRADEIEEAGRDRDPLPA